MDLRKKKVLVTGAGGFIGSHLTEALSRLGAEARVLIRYNSRTDKGWIDRLSPEIQDTLEIFWGDLKEPQSVRRAVKGCQVVFHLGALIAIPYSYMNPADFIQTNVLGTANVLNACMECGVKKVIHTSSSEVYGTARYSPIDEGHPLQGQSPYAASKIGADKLAESYFLAFGLPVATIRPFNTYGPRQSLRAVIPTIISQILVKDQINLGSLYPTRDMTYVGDMVRGFIRMGESEESVGKTINLGTGKEISVGELVDRISALVGKKVAISKDERRVRPGRSEVERLICNNSLARELLEWEPRVSLDQGLRMTIEWVKQQLDGYGRIGEYVI